MFESEFLTSAESSRDNYRRIMTHAAQIVSENFPNQPYCGADARALAKLIPSEFLPEKDNSLQQISESLRTMIENSVAVIILPRSLTCIARHWSRRLQPRW